MSDFSDLVDQVNDLQQNAEDTADTINDLSDSTESNLQDIQDQQASDEENIGQLSFPLTQDTIDLIREQLFLDVQTVSDASVAPTTTAVDGTQILQYDGSTEYLWIMVNGAWVGQKIGGGIDATVALAKLTAGGANGSAVFTKGLLTGYTAPT